MSTLSISIYKFRHNLIGKTFSKADKNENDDDEDRNGAKVGGYKIRKGCKSDNRTIGNECSFIKKIKYIQIKEIPSSCSDIFKRKKF